MRAAEGVEFLSRCTLAGLSIGLAVLGGRESPVLGGVAWATAGLWLVLSVRSALDRGGES